MRDALINPDKLDEIRKLFKSMNSERPPENRLVVCRREFGKASREWRLPSLESILENLDYTMLKKVSIKFT